MNEPVYNGNYFSIFVDTNGVEFVHTGDAALIVPVTIGGEAILSREPAPAFENEQILVLPGGEIDPGGKALVTANRELQEEIGYKAQRLDFLGELLPFGKYLHSKQFIYLARDLQPSRLPGDEDYVIITERLSLADIETWVVTGRLKDAGTIAALFLARAFLIDSNS
jgi:8-oxo-dGTP pyrophosphatase MutT (NUDIX family)